MSKSEQVVRKILDEVDLSMCEIVSVYGFELKKLPLDYQLKAYKLACKAYKLRLEDLGRPF